MPENNNRNYLLVIKKGKNSYLSVEWNLTDLYNGENLYSLPGIDEFTKKIYRTELLQAVLTQNQVAPTELFESFAIIYNYNGKTHEVKEGTIFKEDTEILSEEDLVNFLVNNLNNKNLINEISNLLNFKEPEAKVTEFKFILKNIDLFALKGHNATIAALSTFKDISYEKKRSLLIRISNNIIPKYIQKENIASLTKKDYYQDESKVA